MNINLFLIPFVVILGLMFSRKENDRSRLKYIWICNAVLLLVASLRSPEWLTETYHLDTLNYQEYFESTFNMGWGELKRAFVMRYFLGTGDFDIGFIILCKLISFVTHQFWVFSLLADLLFFVPFGIILYRYTTNVRQIIFAFIFYLMLIQVFFLGGARQMFAIGLDLMAYLAIVDRKKLRAAIFFLLGVSIHFSSLLFLIPLLMVWFGIKPRTLKLLHMLSFLFFSIVLIFPNELIRFMGNAAGMEKYAEYGSGIIKGGSEIFIIWVEALSLYCLLAIRAEDIVSNASIRVFYVMTPMLTLFTPLIISDGSLIRLSLYFNLFLALLVPYAIDCTFDGRKRVAIYAIAIVLMSGITLVISSLKYYFFWQV